MSRLSTQMSASAETDERISEIAQILAAGVLRLRSRQSSRIPAEGGESSVDFTGGQSGHADHVLHVDDPA
jgi:hypothetical protein